MPMTIRGGAKGFLSNDPLTSSTIASTPFSICKRANPKTGGPNTKERLKQIADTYGSDDSKDDDDMTEQDFTGRGEGAGGAKGGVFLAKESQLGARTDTAAAAIVCFFFRQQSFVSSFCLRV